MEDSQKAKFQLVSFFVPETHISCSSEKSGEDYNIAIQPSGEIDKQSNIFRVIIEFQLRSSDDLFKCNIKSIGNFKFEQSISKEQIPDYFYSNAPAILFPYIRAYINTLTGLYGYNPVVLPLLNLSSIKDKFIENTIELNTK